MHVCMYVCVCVCMCVCMYVCIGVYATVGQLSTQIHPTNMRLCACMHVTGKLLTLSAYHLCVYVYVCMHEHMGRAGVVQVRVYVGLCVCNSRSVFHRFSQQICVYAHECMSQVNYSHYVCVCNSRQVFHRFYAGMSKHATGKPLTLSAYRSCGVPSVQQEKSNSPCPQQSSHSLYYAQTTLCTQARLGSPRSRPTSARSAVRCTRWREWIMRDTVGLILFVV
jgi:hypothetical protein